MTKRPAAMLGVGGLCAALALPGPALGQVAPPPPTQATPNAPALGGQTPNAETPSGGVARGVVPPPRGVDPGMVTPPPASAQGTMPIIKPPGTAR